MKRTTQQTLDARPYLTELARGIAMHAPYDGIFELRVPKAYAIRVSRPADVPTRAMMQAAVCITAQGAKSVLVGDEVIEYAAGRIAVYAVDVPVAAQINRATVAEPYLNLKIELDPRKVAELAARVYRHGLPKSQDSRGVWTGPAEPGIIEAAARLLALSTDPADAELLGPLALDEILIRLLRSPVGSRVAQIGQTGSDLDRVAGAVSWLRANYAQPMNVADLASLVNMSVSAFHRQFKVVTAMSPVQYQKALRLQEARRLMLTENLDASRAGGSVGYLSKSQFSREYARFFGSAPMKDVHKLREERIRSPEVSD